MKTLLVYYSRTQITEKIAKTIQKDLDCDIEEITVGDKYDGTIGYIKGGFDASANRVCEINKITKSQRLRFSYNWNSCLGSYNGNTNIQLFKRIWQSNQKSGQFLYMRRQRI